MHIGKSTLQHKAIVEEMLVIVLVFFCELDSYINSVEFLGLHLPFFFLCYFGSFTAGVE